MTLQSRLLVTLSTSFVILWLLVALWLLRDLDQQMQRTLDQRLASSTRMIAGLLAQIPEDEWLQLNTQNLMLPIESDVVCQVRTANTDHIVLQTHSHLPAWVGMQETGFSEHTMHGEKWRIYTQKTNDLFISTGDRLKEREMLYYGTVIATSVPFLVAAFGSLIALWFGIRRGLRPLESLRHELSERHPNSFTPVRVADAPEELKPVIQSLNDLLQRMQSVILREQRFTSNAAHELRTPLTAIKTHLQLASRVGDGQAQPFLTDAELAVERLQCTLEQLLMLARVESSDQWGQNEACAVHDVVRLASADFTHQQRLHIVPLQAATDTALLAIPAELASIALRNVLDNALRHGDPHSAVQFTSHIGQRHISFTISNAGQPLSNNDIEHLTHRFWRSSNATGSGLGLAIVAAIVHRFHGELTFSARAEGGLKAVLTWPRYYP